MAARDVQKLANPIAARHVAQRLFGVAPVSSLLLIVYLAGAIGTAWRLNTSAANRERCPFFSIRCLVWPLTATVFGVLVLIALLAHWYDRLATAFTDRRADIQDDSSGAGTRSARSRFPRPNV